MEPSEAISATENAIRLIVSNVLGDTWRSLVPEATLRKIQRYHDTDLAKRSGVFLGDDLLAYTEFPVLLDIVRADYAKFEPVFGDQTRTEAAFLLMTDLRNAVAHSRELVTFEREILSGTSTRIRNQIQEFRTAAEPVSAHYPLIESAVDGFGNAGTPGLYYIPAGRQLLRLEVGDRVTLRLRAIDPRGRGLNWRILAVQGSYNAVGVPPWVGEPDAVGSPAEIEFTVTENHVDEEFLIRVWLIHGGEKYHRHKTHDDAVTFGYAVNPPLDSPGSHPRK